MRNNKNSKTKFGSFLGGIILIVLFAFIFVHNGKFYLLDFIIGCLVFFILALLGVFVVKKIFRR